MAINDDLHKSSPYFIRSFYTLLITLQSFADDIIMTGNCVASMWKAIPNSLHIDFIHGDIHDWSSKEAWLLITCKCISKLFNEIFRPKYSSLSPRRVNTSPPNTAYMRIGSALVQIMACRLFGAKPLSKPMLGYSHLALRNKFQLNFNENTKLLIQENVFENFFCDMAAIFV